MRTLFLVRHAKSSWASPGLPDFERPLNERGLSDAPQMAKLLAKAAIKPDLIVSSPAKRALTTAFFFANVLGIRNAAVVQNPNIYEAFPQTILDIIHALPAEAQTVMLFGHNPTFTDMANYFVTGRLIDNLPTCGVVQVESSAERWADFSPRNAVVKAQFFPKEVL